MSSADDHENYPGALVSASPVNTDLIIAPSALDLAIAGWLHAKSGRTNSARTARAYSDTLTSFRAACQRTATDVDGDTRQLALLAQGWAATGRPAPATFNQRLPIISSFYRYAAKHGLLEGDNPIGRVERRPVQAYAGAEPLEPSDVAERLGAIDRTKANGA